MSIRRLYAQDEGAVQAETPGEGGRDRFIIETHVYFLQTSFVSSGSSLNRDHHQAGFFHCKESGKDSRKDLLATLYTHTCCPNKCGFQNTVHRT